MKTTTHLNTLLEILSSHSHKQIINHADLFLTIQTLDGDFFDQLRGYFTTLGQVEVDACKNAMPGFETVVSHANTVSSIVINRDVFQMKWF